jgi:hypothetical protein
MGVGHSSSFSRSNTLIDDAAALRTTSLRSDGQQRAGGRSGSIDALQQYLFFDEELIPASSLNKGNLVLFDDADELESNTTTETSTPVDSPELYHFAPCRNFPKNNNATSSRKFDGLSSRIPVKDHHITRNVEASRVIGADDDGHFDCNEHLKRMYDRRTWNMYVRIMEARERSKVQIPTQTIAYSNAVTSDITTLYNEESTTHDEKTYNNANWNYHHSIGPVEGQPFSHGDDEDRHHEHDMIFDCFE